MEIRQTTPFDVIKCVYCDAVTLEEISQLVRTFTFERQMIPSSPYFQAHCQMQGFHCSSLLPVSIIFLPESRLCKRPFRLFFLILFAHRRCHLELSMLLFIVFLSDESCYCWTRRTPSILPVLSLFETHTDCKILAQQF